MFPFLGLGHPTLPCASIISLIPTAPGKNKNEANTVLQEGGAGSLSCHPPVLAFNLLTCCISTFNCNYGCHEGKQMIQETRSGGIEKEKLAKTLMAQFCIAFYLGDQSHEVRVYSYSHATGLRQGLAGE